jgi:hypothetical protein
VSARKLRSSLGMDILPSPIRLQQDDVGSNATDTDC